jgi:hypothetical protein
MSASRTLATDENRIETRIDFALKAQNSSIASLKFFPPQSA